MILELKDGYYIEYNYDGHIPSWVIQIKDKDGNQTKDAIYSKTVNGRDYEINRIKREFMVESLESKAAETKRKTKKAKLNPFKPMSPIMPDIAKGISKFNHAMGVDTGTSSSAGEASGDGGGMGESLDEKFYTRSNLIAAIRKLGFRYNFDKYTDYQLYRIWEYCKDKKADIDAQKAMAKDHRDFHKKYTDENDVTFNDDSFWKDGIEFESDEAAREYFGEAMSIREAFRNIDREIFDKYCESYELEMFYESIKADLTPEEERKIKDFVSKPGITAEEAKTFIAGMEKSKKGFHEDIENPVEEDGSFDDYSLDELVAEVDDSRPFILMRHNSEDDTFESLDVVMAESEEEAMDYFDNEYPEDTLQDCFVKEITDADFANWEDYQPESDKEEAE